MYEELKPYHRAILDKLLSEQFPGRDEILTQVHNSTAKVVEDYKDDYGSVEFSVHARTRSPVLKHVPVYGTALDEDGVPIEFLLHVVDGFIKELEIVKLDGTAIKKMPAASELDLIIAHS